MQRVYHADHDDVKTWKLSALLALCEGNQLVTAHKVLVVRSFDVYFDVSLNKLLNNSRFTDDFGTKDPHMVTSSLSYHVFFGRSRQFHETIR